MLISRRFFAALLLIACCFTSALADYIVKGIVTDAEALPEAYATVRIYAATDSVKPVSVGVTNDAGAFAQTIAEKGSYTLKISSVGKTQVERLFTLDSATPTVDFGSIVVKDDTELGEVEVVAVKPLVSKEIDRIGYDVQADDDSKTATLQEILRKVPMVTVESDGTIKVRGQSNFKIYRNGRPNNQLTNNAKDVLAAIPASMIKKIEVITDPGAKEDAEGVGAILNIVTIDNTSINGIMGTARIGANTQNEYPSGSVWLTGNIGKVAVSANGGYGHQSKRSKVLNEIDNTYVETGNRLHSLLEASTPANVFNYGIDASYELDSLNLFTLDFGGWNYRATSDKETLVESYAPDNQLIYSYRQVGGIPKATYLDWNGNFNYQHSTHRKGETLTLSYAISTNNDDTRTRYTYTDLVNFPVQYSGLDQYSKLNFIEHTGQIDWTRPFNEHHTLAVGGKFIQRNNHSIADIDYVDYATSHSDFIHRTSVAAAYADYRLNYGKWSGRAGLRYEFSRLAAKYNDGSNDDFSSNLSDWVPQASLMYTPSVSSSWKLAYQTRINRPGINYLNPAVYETPTSVTYGNPNLESMRHNSVSLDYSYFAQKFNISLSLSYSSTRNNIASIVTVDRNDVITTTYGNVGKQDVCPLEIYLQWNMTPKTSVMLNGSVEYDRYVVPTSSLSNHRWGVSSYLNVTQRLPWKLRLQGLFAYSTSGLASVYSYEDNTLRSAYYQLSLQRSFLKDDRLTVRLTASAPFTNDLEYRTIYNRGDYYGHDTTTALNRRHFGISVSLRFGSVKSEVKKVAKSITNDDLTGGSSVPLTGM